MKKTIIKIVLASNTNKWWNNFIGETFECIEIDGEWHLTDPALQKLSLLKNIVTYSAIIPKVYTEIAVDDVLFRDAIYYLQDNIEDFSEIKYKNQPDCKVSYNCVNMASAITALNILRGKEMYIKMFPNKKLKDISKE
jgi:hypothetical protein